MTGSAKQSIAPQERMDCFVAEFIIGPAEGGTRWLLAMTGRENENSRRHFCRRPLLLRDRPYFGYLNSGAAFSASLVVFIDAIHLSFLASWRILTEAGDTAT